MNINALRDADDNAGFYAAACAADINATWAGAELWVSIDGGANYARLASLTAEATMGTTTNAQANFAGGNIPDELSSVNVRLSHGSLSSTTNDGLLSGVFCCIIGDEIEFARTATLQSNGTYTVTGFLRGRRGSEYAMPHHRIGERFILVNVTTLAEVPQITSEIGQTRLYKAVGGGSTLAATTAKSFKNDGARLKPYAPVHLGGGVEANGDWTLRWVRRGRTSGEWRNSVDVPLGESTESYEVEIWNSTFTTLKRTITGLTSQTATYTSAQQTTDFGGAQTDVYFAVYQLSGTVGRGYAGYGHVAATGSAAPAAPPALAPPPPPAPGPTPVPSPIGIGPYAVTLPDPGPAPAPAPGTTDSNGDATLIALIAATPGNDIVVPDDIIYVVDAPIAVPDGKTLRAADGEAVTIKRANGYTGDILTITSGTGSAVRNITFDGNYANNLASEGSSGACAIKVTGGGSVAIEHNKFLNCPSFAVWAYNSPGLSIRYNQFIETYHAVRIDGNNLPNSGTIDGNEFTNTTAFKSIQHIEAINTKSLSIKNNEMEGAGLLEPTTHGFEGTWGNSIYIWNSDGYIVENNTAGDNHWSAAVSGQGGTNGVFRNNELNDGAATPCAIWIEQAGSEYITVDRNILNGSVEVGDTGGDHSTVTDNIINTVEMAVNVNSAAKDILVQRNVMTSLNGTFRAVYLWDKSTPTGIDCRVLDNTIVGFDKGVEINNPGGVGTIYDITVTGNYFEDTSPIVEIPGGITVDPSCNIQSVSAPAPAPSPSIGTIAVANMPETILQSHTHNGVAYWVHDNAWGPGLLTRGTYTGLTGSQYEQYVGISYDQGVNGAVAYRQSWKWPEGTTEVKSYPSVVYGAHPGWFNTGTTPGGLRILLPDLTYRDVAPCGPTPGTVLPRQLPIAPLYSSFDWEHQEAPTGQGHLSYDIWLQSDGAQINGFGNSPKTFEIMIPLTYWGDGMLADGTGGYGHWAARNPSWNTGVDVTIQGYLFRVFYAPNFNGSWQFVVFQPRTPTTILPGTFDLAPFINYVQTAGWAVGPQWCMSAELGVEPHKGTGDLVVKTRFWV